VLIQLLCTQSCSAVITS